MTAITEDYVSFEIAKLLKEKGFSENTEHKIWYVIKQFSTGCHWNSCTYKVGDITREYNDNCCISMPTLQMTMKWLREVHHIHTEICLYKTNKDDIEPKKSRKSPYYTFGVWNTVTGDNIDKRLTNDFIGDTYEQACEAAIKYCLEYLI